MHSFFHGLDRLYLSPFQLIGCQAPQTHGNSCLCTAHRCKVSLRNCFRFIETPTMIQPIPRKRIQISHFRKEKKKKTCWHSPVWDMCVAGSCYLLLIMKWCFSICWSFVSIYCNHLIGCMLFGCALMGSLVCWCALIGRLRVPMVLIGWLRVPMNLDWQTKGSDGPWLADGGVLRGSWLSLLRCV